MVQLSGDKVSVDKDFARFGAKSYAINKINTVEVREHRPNGQAGAWVFGLLALVFLVAAIGATAQDDGSPVSQLVIALLCAGIAYWMFLRSKVIEYQLYLMTSSSEAQAFLSRDGEEVARLRKSIEAAMANS